ncbi:imidazole glycerol phosphate synthase subunit HisF [Luteibaculum oceani]|uniref:Imidazole glycerol phosphate synthase subunit HisF n=1 Tax=Luteibaculum oceani TaxID=1294296 RepID=A0A5C6VAS9_9FLAO|nr:imidazole glycerol phosphate synthase subunit HisF [Luteibaculum oceani]TXC81476.1 imidazole glycerol phosphate synthase subunit HisF [Luteibaculum oceani]
MPTKRIIPCLDIKDGRTVKGVNFVSLRDAGDPVELAAAYAYKGADELVFLDITATVEGRKTFSKLVEDIARKIDIPFAVGGGISSVEDAEILLRAGADKIAVNSAAIRNPDLVKELAHAFGSQCVVCAIDVKQTELGLEVFSHGGRKATGINAEAWAKRLVDLGCGEILLTSMDHDGTKNGFAIDITRKIAQSVEVPIIASGGAGEMKHFSELFKAEGIDAGLAASIFHFGEIEIPQLKAYLADQGIEIRQ